MAEKWHLAVNTCRMSGWQKQRGVMLHTSHTFSLSPPPLWFVLPSTPSPPHLLPWRHTGGELMEVSTNRTSHGGDDVIGPERGSRRCTRREEEDAAVAMQVTGQGRLFGFFFPDVSLTVAHARARRHSRTHTLSICLWSSCSTKYLMDSNQHICYQTDNAWSAW